MPVEFEVTPRFADYLRLQYHGIYRQQRWIVWIAAALVVLFLVAPFAMAWEGNPTLVERFWSMRMVLILPVLVFVLMPSLIYFEARRRWARAAELREKRTYLFSDTGMTMKGATFSAAFDWSHIRRAETVRDLLLLWTGQPIAHLLPMRELRERGVVDDLVALLRRHIADCRGLGHNATTGEATRA